MVYSEKGKEANRSAQAKEIGRGEIQVVYKGVCNYGEKRFV